MKDDYHKSGFDNQFEMQWKFRRIEGTESKSKVTGNHPMTLSKIPETGKIIA